ncbi:MAG: response regulator transcription factor [Saccharofermentanaceae bacterium]|nr:response regulator transcription factor [Saccharofermentanaceae bacterium]
MRIMIVDDDPLVQESLKIILEKDGDIEVVSLCGSGREAVSAFAEAKPDLVLSDIRMEDMDGLQATSEILKIDPDAKVILLTTFLDDEYINQALKVGAKGYILKQDCASLSDAVRAVYGGQTVFGGKIVERLPDLLNRSESFRWEDYDITPKEKEIVELVAEGLSNKEIAQKMFLGEGTVRNMISSVLSKLDLRDRTQLACFYYQRIKI